VGFFSGKDLSQMMIKGLGRIAESEAFAWSDEQRAALRRLGTHGLRHTFATLGVQHEHHPIPVDLMKDLLGHASLQTTSLYVQTSIKRAERVMADFFEKE
jgi:integrase